MSDKPLYLPSVTLAGVVYNDNRPLLERVCRVLQYCNTLAYFHHTILFTAIKPERSVRPQVIQIPRLERDTFQTWVVKSVAPYVESDFLMWINEDGFPLRPERWSDKFFKYDFIGAPWANKAVGNDGFSIQSQRYLHAVASEMPWHTGKCPSDFWSWEQEPAKYGLNVADFEVARRFSIESPAFSDGEPTFGFHGRVIPENYALGWKLIEESEK